MRLTTLLATVIFAASIALHMASPASACVCRGEPPEELVSGVNRIAVGVVSDFQLRLDESPEWMPMGMEPDQAVAPVATIEVRRYLKGNGQATILVSDPVSGQCSALGGGDVIGLKGIFFLQDDPDDASYDTNSCLGSRLEPAYLGADASDYLSQYVAEVEAVTGPGQPPNSHDPPRELMWLAAAILPLAFLAAATLAPWRRR